MTPTQTSFISYHSYISRPVYPLYAHFIFRTHTQTHPSTTCRRTTNTWSVTSSCGSVSTGLRTWSRVIDTALRASLCAHTLTFIMIGGLERKSKRIVWLVLMKGSGGPTFISACFLSSWSCIPTSERTVSGMTSQKSSSTWLCVRLIFGKDPSRESAVSYSIKLRNTGRIWV